MRRSMSWLAGRGSDSSALFRPDDLRGGASRPAANALDHDVDSVMPATVGAGAGAVRTVLDGAV